MALPVAAMHAPRSDEPPPGTETVLVVEDDDAVRFFTEAVLKAAGYDVLTASNGIEALSIARSSARPIHLLMSDVVMPVLGGHALAEQFHALRPDARVLFTSGYTPEAVSRKGIAIPADQFIQKPYSPAGAVPEDPRHPRSLMGGTRRVPIRSSSSSSSRVTW